MSIGTLNIHVLHEICQRLASSKDTLNLFASSAGLFSEIRSVMITQIQSESIAGIGNVAKQFVEDCLIKITKDLSTNADLREKYFQLFVHGYIGTDVISSSSQLHHYDWECGAMAKGCDCFDAESTTQLFNSFKYLGLFPLASETAIINHKQEAMDNLFEFSEENGCDKEITLTWESGAKLSLQLDVDDTGTFLIVKLYHTNSDDPTFSTTYEFPKGMDSSSWIEDLKQKLRQNISDGYMFGAMQNITCTSEYCETWRRAYIIIECIPHYKQMMSVK